VADIFLGYGGPNRDFARWSVNWLEKCGWSVFWDGELHSGQPFDTRIENELDQAGCVVVVWTRDSVNLDSSTEESRLTLVGARKLPTDSEIDQRVDADLAGLEARALSKTGLESSDVVAEPVVVTGLHLENIGDAAFHIKLGKDDLIRFTPLGVTIINSSLISAPSI
jgi:hypothetical protein